MVLSRRATRALRPAAWALGLYPLARVAWWLRDGLAGLGANPIERILHHTGWWALVMLVVTLAVTPVRRLTGLNPLARLRRPLGLFAFFYATLHVSTYIGLDMFFDMGDIVEDVIEHPYVTIGLLTWLLLLPLAITSTRGWVRRLGGKRWALLHRLIYVAAITGTVHYLWAVKKDTYLPLVYLTVFAVLLGWRLWGALARRRRDAGAMLAKGRSASSTATG